MDRFTESARLVEASSSSSRTVQLTLIRAGWGNKAHNHYYPPETLERAAREKIFDGVKMYADHLSEGQKKTLGSLPRSIRDIAGRVTRTWYDAPSRSIKGEARLVPWFHSLVESDPDLVEASINAGGRASQRVIEGRQGRFVEAIVQAASVDWVSQGGAGGRIDSLLEAHMEEAAEMYEELTVDTLVEAKPAVVKEVLDGPLNERAVAAETELAELKAAQAKLEEGKGEGSEEEGTPEATAVESLTEAQVREIAKDVAGEVVREVLESQEADRRHDAKVKELVEAHQGLTPKSQISLTQEFVGRRAEFETPEALQEAVSASCDERVEELREAAPRGVTGLGPSSDTLIESRTSGKGVDAIIDEQFGISQPKEDPAPAAV